MKDQSYPKLQRAKEQTLDYSSETSSGGGSLGLSALSCTQILAQAKVKPRSLTPWEGGLEADKYVSEAIC